MTTPTVTEIRRNGNPVGERIELARYTVPIGERVLYGQRVNGVVRFLPEEPVVLDSALGSSEKSGCCPREPLQADGSSSPARQKRANDDGGSAEAADAATPRRGRTGPRVELARYSIPAGDRVLYGQRVDGVVRLTDVPLEAGGRAYLVERGLEEEGPNANAALHALIADYLRQASILDAVPMAECSGKGSSMHGAQILARCWRSHYESDVSMIGCRLAHAAGMHQQQRLGGAADMAAFATKQHGEARTGGLLLSFQSDSPAGRDSLARNTGLKQQDA